MPNTKISLKVYPNISGEAIGVRVLGHEIEVDSRMRDWKKEAVQ